MPLLWPSKTPQDCQKVKSCLCAVGPVNFYIPLMWEATEAADIHGFKMSLWTTDQKRDCRSKREGCAL